MKKQQMLNIILIGMPGVGKSTVGLIIAKSLDLPLVDTDRVIEARAGRPLSQIIARFGTEYFKEFEERCVLDLNVAEAVVATGGSVVYSERAMRHLQAHGHIVWLSLSFELLQERLADLDARGVAYREGQSLRDLYLEREPLYARYASFRVECDGLGEHEVAESILSRLKAVAGGP